MEGYIKSAIILLISFTIIEAIEIQTAKNINIQTPKKPETLLYGVVTPECFYEIYYKHNFDIKCLKFVFSKLLGYGIVFASAILKVPQILNIIRAKSTAGLNELVLYMEMLGYMVSMLYSMHYGMPFSTYGESVFITIQAAVILCLLWYYNRSRYPIHIVIALIIGYFTFGLFLYDSRFLDNTKWSYLYISLTQLSIFLIGTTLIKSGVQ